MNDKNRGAREVHQGNYHVFITITVRQIVAAKYGKRLH